MISEADLKWYRSSERASRGFCRQCGSSLFWKPDHGRYISIMAGSLGIPTGLEAVEHIFVRDASDYYVIDHSLPRFETYSPVTSDE